MKSLLKLLLWLAVVRGLVAPLSAQGTLGGQLPPSLTLTITAPAKGTQFEPGAPIPIQATAVDPQGAVYRLELYAGAKRIGVSEILTLVAIPPGEPVSHEFLWKDAPPGRHELRVKAAAGEFPVLSAPVTIEVGGTLETPMAWVEAVDPVAMEGGASDAGQKDVLRFRIHREGNLQPEVFVYFHLEGPAQPGVDFLVPPNSMPARLPANEPFVEVVVEPYDDRLSEGPEALVFTLDPSPTMGPMEPYRIDPHRPHAKGIIGDNEPVFTFQLPESGDWFPQGAPVPIRVLTTWTAGFVSQLEFLADGKKIGDSVVNFIQAPPPGTPVRHEFIWQDAPAGEHRLTVQTALADGSVVESAEARNIRVGLVAEVPEVSLTVVDGEFGEGDADAPDSADVVVRRTGPTDQALTVFLHWEGSATPGVDYGPVTSEVLFPKGTKEVHLRPAGFKDQLQEGDEQVVISIIVPPSLPGFALYRVAGEGRVKLLLHDGSGGGGIPVVTVETGRPYALEGDRFNRGEFLLQRTGDLSRDIMVNFGVSGQARRGLDYRLVLNPCDDCAAPDQEFTGDSVLMPAGQATVILGVLATFDGLLAVVEPVLEDVQLQVYTPPVPEIVGAKPPYLAGSPDQAAVQVVDRKNPNAAELVLIEPEAGAVLPLGQPNTLRAIAVDPVGSIRRVEFVANDQSIGVSEILTKDVDIPGRLRLHTFLWTVADATLAGPYTLTARAKNAAGSEIQAGLVPVTVGETEPTLPVVTITPWQKTAFERGDWKSRVGGFALTRHGGPDFAQPLTVFVEVGGTATAGVDYLWSFPEDGEAGPDTDQSLPFFGPFLPVTFPAGAAAVELIFTASADELVEGDETVHLELIEPPIRSLGFPNLLPFPAYYLIGEPHAGGVVIQDANVDQPFIGLTQPVGGAQFHVGQVIPLEATAVRPDAGVESIEFLADGQVIATVNYCCDVCDCAPAPKGQPFTARFDWKSATPGPHVLVARTFAGPNQVLESAPVTIFVGDAEPGALVIVTPPDGAAFPLGKTITIDTVGADPTSVVSTVEFFANGEKIGETCFLCVAWGIFPPGTPLHNQIQWTPSKPGPYVLTAVGHFGEDRRITSPPVTVQIGGQVEGPRLSLTQPLNGAHVPAGADVPVVAVGVGREGGITDVVLLVDGKPAGESHLQFFRPPGADEEVRHEFAVRLEPGTHQLVVRDLFDPAVASAPVTVVAGKAEAAITWVAPHEGAEFPAGKTIVLEVKAVDPTGIFFQVEFFDGDVLIGTSEFSCPLCRLAAGAVIPHKFEWHGASAGKHLLTARVTRADGTVVSSIPRHISVTGDHPPGSFVTRVLPAGYEAGKAFKVQLEARPGPTVAAYVVEEQPPHLLPAPGLAGSLASPWLVTVISHNGVFDPQTGKVKFGPFFDHAPRTLTYELVANFVPDLARFEGVGVADGTSSPIGGDRELLGSSRHPADREPADDALSAAELTAYAAAWKREQAWPGGPNPIPVAYVTRAAVLWQGGEHYAYDPASGAPPFCWVNDVSAAPNDDRATPPAPLAGLAVRHEEVQADGSLRVTLRVTLAPGARAFAVEEHLPATEAVSGITGGGEFTPGSRVLRWGPYFVGANPVLSYVRSGVIAGTGPKGIVSFDGQNLPIHGPRGASDERVDRLVGVDRLHDGSHQVCLEADALQQGAEYELQVGTDLQHWTPVGVFSNGQDTGFARDSGATNAEVRFYRAVRVR